MCIRDSVDTVEKYVREKREKGMVNFTNMHVLLAAYTRLVSQRPGLNRFISGQKIYARNHFEAMLCIKKEMKLNSPDSVISMVFPLDATAEQIYQITEKLVEDAKGETTNFDDTARILDYIPGLVKKFAFWLLRLLDYFGPVSYTHLDVYKRQVPTSAVLKNAPEMLPISGRK